MSLFSGRQDDSSLFDRGDETRDGSSQNTGQTQNPGQHQRPNPSQTSTPYSAAPQYSAQPQYPTQYQAPGQYAAPGQYQPAPATSASSAPIGIQQPIGAPQQGYPQQPPQQQGYQQQPYQRPQWQNVPGLTGRRVASASRPFQTPKGIFIAACVGLVIPLLGIVSLGASIMALSKHRKTAPGQKVDPMLIGALVVSVLGLLIGVTRWLLPVFTQ